MPWTQSEAMMLKQTGNWVRAMSEPACSLGLQREASVEGRVWESEVSKARQRSLVVASQSWDFTLKNRNLSKVVSEKRLFLYCVDGLGLWCVCVHACFKTQSLD